MKLMCSTDLWLIFYSLIKSFVQLLLSWNLSLFGKKNMSPYFKFTDVIEKIKFRLPCAHPTRNSYLGFFRRMHNALKEFFSQLFSLSPAVLRHITCICKYILLERQKYFDVRPWRFHDFHINWWWYKGTKIKGKCWC